jgi:hypothetical protein
LLEEILYKSGCDSIEKNEGEMFFVADSYIWNQEDIPFKEYRNCVIIPWQRFLVGRFHLNNSKNVISNNFNIQTP